MVDGQRVLFAPVGCTTLAALRRRFKPVPLSLVGLLLRFSNLFDSIRFADHTAGIARHHWLFAVSGSKAMVASRVYVTTCGD